jgi:hypothetical protein
LKRFKVFIFIIDNRIDEEGALNRNKGIPGERLNKQEINGIMIKLHKNKNGDVAEISSDVAIGNVDILLQLMADAVYNNSAYGMIIHSSSLPQKFFELKTGIAGEILQKFSNYRMKLAIVGDFTEVKSKSLRDFIRESNDRKIITFVPSVEEALVLLAK